MRMNEIDYSAGAPIEGYGDDGFRVAAVFHAGPTIVAPGGARAWEGGGLSVAALEALRPLAEEVDLVLVGVGPTLAPLSQEILSAAEEAGLFLEPMTTPSACRTYNVLLSEGRRVAAALLPMKRD